MDPRTEKMLAERAERKAAPPAPQRRPVNIKLLAGAGAAVLFAAYYFAVALPAQRADQLEVETRAAERVKADTSSKHVSVADCLAKVQADAEAQWTAACKAKKQGPSCPLPEHQADAFESAESAARNACLIGH
jgi:hypothetical protein